MPVALHRILRQVNNYNNTLRVYLLILCPCVALVVLFFFYKGPLSSVLIRDWGLVSGWDGAHYYFWLRSLVFDGDIDFRNDIISFSYLPPDKKEMLLSQPLTATGLLPNKYAIGWALLFSPGMLLGGLLTLVLNTFGSTYPIDGYSVPFQFGLTLIHIVYAVLSITFLYRLLSLLVKDRAIALTATLFAWAGSPLLFYQTADITMAHGVTFFCLSGLFYLCEKLRVDCSVKFKHFFILGMLSGLVVACRPQTVVYLFYPAVLVCQQLAIKNYKPAVASTLPFLGVVAIQLICTWSLYGTPFTYTYQGETFNFLAPEFASIFFSPFHGAFYWHPLLLIGTVGFLLSLRRKHDLLRLCLLASVTCNLYINASWYCWWFGASFGQRALEGLVILGAIGFSELLQLESKPLRHAICAVVCCLVFWNINLTALAMRGVLPLDRPVTISEMASITSTFWVAKFTAIGH